MSRPTRRRLICLALLLGLAAAARASTMLPLTVEQLRDRAERIALLEAVSSRVEIRDGRPSTLVECRVLTAFKGAGERAITLRLPGGRVGTLTMRIPGAPLPEVGDVFLAFLGRDDSLPAAATWRPIGWGQGMFALVERDGRVYAVQTLAHAPEIFLNCGETTDRCLDRLGVIAFAYPDLLRRPARRGD